MMQLVPEAIFIASVFIYTVGNAVNRLKKLSQFDKAPAFTK